MLRCRCARRQSTRKRQTLTCCTSWTPGAPGTEVRRPALHSCAASLPLHVPLHLHAGSAVTPAGSGLHRRHVAAGDQALCRHDTRGAGTPPQPASAARTPHLLSTRDPAPTRASFCQAETRDTSCTSSGCAPPARPTPTSSSSETQWAPQARACDVDWLQTPQLGGLLNVAPCA